MITSQDVINVINNAERKIKFTPSNCFQPFEVAWRLETNDNSGYSTEHDFDKAFADGPAWGKAAYLTMYNGCIADKVEASADIADDLNRFGVAEFIDRVFEYLPLCEFRLSYRVRADKNGIVCGRF